MEHISYDRLVHTTIANGNLLRLFGDGGQIEMRPVFALVLQDVSDQIIDMQPLHHQDDDALLLIVEASGEGGFEPADDSVSSCLRHGVFRLERIIDNDVCAADTGQRPADRGCIAKASFGRQKLDYGVLLGAHTRKEAPILAASNHRPKLPVEILGKLIRIARGNDAAPEQEGGIGNGGRRAI